ncbi:MAG: DNA-binding response regulator [Gemmatimonadetes bacterium]|nr:DNA-binding response regulator [Gemmatimonadota bacterium]
MSSPDASADPVLLLETRDLVFRARLESVAHAARWQVSRVPPATLAVVELNGSAAIARVRALVAGGIPVLAFGPHVEADLLRAAREAGAEAVPNSQVEAALRRRLEVAG